MKRSYSEVDPPLSWKSLKTTEKEEKLVESKSKLRTRSMSFFELDTDVVLYFLNRMDMSELLALMATFPDIEKEVDFAKMRLEKCELKLLRVMSSVSIGNFTWAFYNWACWDRPNEKESNRTVGTLSLDVYQDNYCTWNSEVEDTMAAALEFVNWILKTFPKTKLEYLDFLSDRSEGVLKMPVMKQFKEEKISAPFIGEETLENFFKESLKQHQVVVLEREETYKIARVKTVNNDPLGLKPTEWFKGFLYQHQIEVILLKNMNLNEENLNHIIRDWIELETRKFLYLEARNVGGLDESEILSGFTLEQWDIEEMEKFEENTLLRKYWLEQGQIIRNRNDEPASVYFNLETGIFVFVVWHTDTMFSLLRGLEEI